MSTRTADTARTSSADLTEQAARQLVTRITRGLAAVWDDVTTAYVGRAWLALGYTSWDELCRSEFGSTNIHLPREERHEVVASLRDAGMSTRAIESATGLGHATVVRAAAGGPNGPREPVTGLDGKTYRPQRQPPSEDIVDAENVDTPSTPPTQKRRSMIKQADTAGWEIRKAAYKIKRLIDDDRLKRNREQLDSALGGHLAFVAETVAEARRVLGGEQ